MGIDDDRREQAILDAAVDLLLRFGYDRLKMGDVADAVGLHRGLVYLLFKSKDELVEAVCVRELDKYAGAWREHFANDPEGGSVGSLGRAQLGALKSLPLASAIVARDEEVLGKYLRKPGNLFERPLMRTSGVREYLESMQRIGVVREDADAGAAAFIIDALTPAIRRTFLRTTNARADPDQPSWEAVLQTFADMLDRSLSPPGGANLAAGKANLLDGIDRARADFAARFNRQHREKGTDGHE